MSPTEAIVTVLLLLAGILGAQAGDPMSQIDYMRLSYKANKQSFAFGSFRFEYTIGVSANATDAESGIYQQSIKEDGLYIFDGKNARYELTASPKDILAVTRWIDPDRDSTRRKSMSLANTFRMLTDGKVTFMDSTGVGRAGAPLPHLPQISADIRLYRSSFEFPLYIGDESGRPYDLFGDLTTIKDGKASLAELDLDARLNGLKVCKVSYTYKDGTKTYWVDLNRGSVPLRILNHYDPTGTDVVFIFDDLVQVAGAGWLPRRMLHIIANGVSVSQLTITDIDVQHKPQLSAFQLEFPKPVRVVDGARQLVYSRRKTWGLLDLPSRSSPDARPAVPKSHVAPAELPGEIEAGPHWAIIVLLVLLVLAASCSVVLARRRGKRSQGARDGQGAR
jgi:hypothetical protein